MINFAIMREPVNWLLVTTMAGLGILIVSIISAPLRAETSA